MPILFNPDKKKGIFKIPTGGTQGISCAFSYSAASYTDADPDPTPTITGTSGGTFTSTAGIVINADTGEIDLSASAVNTYVVTYTVRGKACTQSVEITASFANTYSMNFDGVDDYFKTGIFSDLDGGTTASFSIWVKPISGVPTLEYVFSNPRSAVANESQFALILYEGQRINFNVTSRVSQTVYGDITAITYGSWNNIIITVDLSLAAADRAKIYVNGVDKTTAIAMATVTNFLTATDGLFIGEEANAGYNPFNGNADEFAIWDSVLSGANITSIYNSGTPTNLTSLSPVGWWRMGDNGSFKSPQWLLPTEANKDKVSNYSMAFDGVDDYINTGSSSQDGASTLTISAWFNTSYDNWQYFFGDNSIKLNIKQSYPDRVDFTFNGSIDYRSTNFTITLGTWNHVALVFDGSLVQADRLKIYLNNSLLTNDLSGTGDTTFVADNNFMLGRAGTYSAQEWNGNLDEISVFSTAKDVSGIATLWNSGTPGDLTSLSPVNWWKMGEEETFSTNWTLTDQGSGSDNGTSANMTVEDRVGNAKNSTSNAVSLNMVEADREEETP